MTDKKNIDNKEDSHNNKVEFKNNKMKRNHISSSDSSDDENNNNKKSSNIKKNCKKKIKKINNNNGLKNNDPFYELIEEMLIQNKIQKNCSNKNIAINSDKDKHVSDKVTNNTSDKDEHTSEKEDDTSEKEDDTSEKEDDTSVKEDDTSEKEDDTSDKDTDNSSSDKEIIEDDNFINYEINKPLLINYENNDDSIKYIKNKKRNNKFHFNLEEEEEEPIIEPEIDLRPVHEIDFEVDTLDDLIKVGKLKEFDDYSKKQYTVDIEGIHRMIPALLEFKEMIGLEGIKSQVVEQILYLCGENHSQFNNCKKEKTSHKKNDLTSKSLLSQLLMGCNAGGNINSGTHYRMTESVISDDNQYDMFHTVIYGPPGVGKTAFAKLLARIFLNLGITKNDTFRIARRSDLVGEYVGHTAVKTQKVINESLGGVLFIDEVYSLGNGGNANSDGRTDSFSNECINTLNQNLTEKKGKFICIIAGYKEETEKNFFKLNPGLKRRFSFYYNIDGYDWKELTNILLFKINKLNKWEADSSLKDKLFQDSFLKDKTKHFPHYAGDIETLLLNVKISHCKRVFGKDKSIHHIITYHDLKTGYKRYINQKYSYSEQEKLDNNPACFMYT